MAYVIAAIVMILSVIEGHFPVTSLIRWDFSYICVPVDKTSSLYICRASCYTKMKLIK